MGAANVVRQQRVVSVVFMTGATGYLGAAAARAARQRGIHVLGLARSAAAAGALADAGIEPVVGRLEDVDVLRCGVEGADAVLHAAFARDAYQRLDEAVAVEQRATAALVDVASRCGVPLVYTSGLGVVGDTGGAVVDEDDEPATPLAMVWRRELELQVLDGGGVVIRPAFVYGRGGGDILRALVAFAVEHGVAVYPGDGLNAWPNVDVDDVGEAYILAIQQALRSTVLNLAAGEATPRSVCEAISRLVGGTASSLPLEQASGVVPYAEWIGRTSVRVDSTKARRLLGWDPAGRDIHHDIEFGSYRTLLGEVNP